MSIEKNPMNVNLDVRQHNGYKIYNDKIGLRGSALGEILRLRECMSEEEIEKIKNFFTNNLPLNSLNHFDISEFPTPYFKGTWRYPISDEVRSKIRDGIREIQEKNGDIVVASDQTLKTRIINKKIGLPQDLLKRIIDRTDPKAVKTITPENLKKIDDFFHTHLPNNPNLLKECDIVRVNRNGKKLDANNCTKSITDELRKSKKPLYSITDIVIEKIKECIIAFYNTENVDAIVTDHTKKRTKFKIIDNSKEHTNQPQNEGFPEQIDPPSKRTKTTPQTINSQPFPTQAILAFEDPLLNSQFLPFLPIGTVQPNNVETEDGRPFPNLQPIVSDPAASLDPAPFLLNVIQSPLNQSQQNEQIDLLSDGPFLLEEEKKLPDPDTYVQFDELLNLIPDEEIEEFFSPEDPVQTASTNPPASSTQGDLFLTFSFEDDLFPLENTLDNK